MRHPKTIFITGASSGIGAALAKVYAAEGITLALVGRQAVRLEEAASACREKGAVVHTALIDVRDRKALTDFIIHIDGLHAIDLIVANAGISAGSGLGGVETEEQVLKIFETNVNGVLNTVHAILPNMIARGHGQIAIMASLASIRALPSAPAYSASKAAVRFYGEGLRGLLKKRGVEVNVICPGYIETPMTARNPFFMPFIMSADAAARRIKHGLAHSKGCIAFPKRLYYPLCLFGALPRFITDPLFNSLPGKPQIS